MSLYANGTNTSHMIMNQPEIKELPMLNWGVLALSILILATMMGNVLVCLAVCWESRLQNMTNYFLMSLAIADLLVATLVMPLGMVVELYGYFPFQADICVIWLSMDVSMCTASIWHMCTMSMDRYFTLKYPMKYGRNKTKTMVALKIAFVWIVSAAISSPVLITGFTNHASVLQDNLCIITNRNFLLYGSIVAFYIPLVIMVVTYVLTIKILCRNHKLMEKISREHTQLTVTQKHQNGSAGSTLYANTSFLSPEISYKRYSARPSFDASGMASISCEASINDVSFHLGDSQSKDLDNLVLALQNKDSAVTQGSKENDKLKSTTTTTKNEYCCNHIGGVADDDEEGKNSLLEIKGISFDSSHRNSLLSSLSASQPNLLTNPNSNLNTVRRSSSCRSRNNTTSAETSNGHLTNVPTTTSAHCNNGLLNPQCDDKYTTAIWNAQSQPNLIGPSKSFPLEVSLSQNSFLPHHHHHHKHCSDRTNINNNKKPRDHHYHQIYTSSQPHLPSMNKGFLSPMGSPITFQYPSIKSITSALDLESVKNYDCISACSSKNSCQSMWSDFERPVMLEKLTKIEAEMDLCIMENSSEENTPTQKQIFEALQNCSLERNASLNNSLSNLNQNENNNQVVPTIPPVCISSPTPNLSQEHSPSRSSTEIIDSTQKLNNCNDNIPTHEMDDNTPTVAGLICKQGDFLYTVERAISMNSIDNDETIFNNNSSDISSQCTSNNVSCNNSQLDISVSFAAVTQHSSYGTYLNVVKPNNCNAVANNNAIECNHSNDSINSQQLHLMNNVNSCCNNHIKQNQTCSSNDSNKSTCGSSTEDNGLTSDDCLSDTVSQTTQTTYTTLGPHISPKFHPLRHKNNASFLLKTLTKKVNKYPHIRMHNGGSVLNSSNIISKRTANNERKASKVLGIIFGVFVLLWTPFFIMNILASVCSSCVTGLTPALMTTITWLGYMSSLANPIIYTMFNTSFRKAFVKILTCKYKICTGKVQNNGHNKYKYNYSYYKPSTTYNKTLTHNTSASRLMKI